jgi:Leucine-rich repeat (LRR) protein
VRFVDTLTRWCSTPLLATLLCMKTVVRLVCRALSRLTGLTSFNAMNNRLSRVPDELCQLTDLYRLGLKSNALEELPAAFGSLTALVELFLTDNQLTELPDSIGQCVKLVKLQVRCKQPL